MLAKHFRAISLIMSACVLALDVNGAAAAARHAAMVIDANTGAVLHNEDGDELRYPASLTKMMTLYLVFELIEAGRLSYDDRIPISERAASAQPSKLGLKPGDSIRVQDAVKALVTKSANDVAIAVAEKIGGSEFAFARLMTERARDLGMTRTTFRNASGLPDPAQVTTARDMITLGIRLQDNFPQHYRHFSTRHFAYGRKQYRNHNTMLASFTGIDGIKTGYTAKSGFNLVTSVRRDGRHIVAAVFGGASSATRNGEMRVLLLKALPEASAEKTRKPLLVAKLRQKPRLLAANVLGGADKPKTRGLRAKGRETVAAGALNAPAAKPWRQEVRVADVQTPPPPQRAAVQVFKMRRVSVLDPAPAQPALVPQRPRLLTASASGFAPAEEGSASANARDVTPDDFSETRHIAGPNFAAASAEPQHREPTMEDLIAASTPVSEDPPVVRTAARIETTGSLATPSPAILPASRVLAPSTFADQARTLARVVEPPADAPRRRVAARGERGGAFAIQIGAFGSAAEADRRLDSVARMANGRLSGHPHMTQAVTRGDKQFYRARFREFDQADASETCAFLKSQQVDCLVLAAE